MELCRVWFRHFRFSQRIWVVRSAGLFGFGISEMQAVQSKGPEQSVPLGSFEPMPCCSSCFLFVC